MLVLFSCWLLASKEGTLIGQTFVTVFAKSALQSIGALVLGAILRVDALEMLTLRARSVQLGLARHTLVPVALVRHAVSIERALLAVLVLGLARTDRIRELVVAVRRRLATLRVLHTRVGQLANAVDRGTVR